MTTASSVTAIDIVLEPDVTMLQRAESVNAELLGVYPAGFPLDEAHRPHITILQAYVHADRFDDLCASVAKLVAGEAVTEWTLRATAYYYLPWHDLGVAGIVIEPTTPMLTLQRAWIATATPYLAQERGADAFVRTPADPEINQATMDYVGEFAAEHSGPNFNPHVTVGMAPQTYLDPMLATPFEAFTFHPVGISIYQLGNMGTAARKLYAVPGIA